MFAGASAVVVALFPRIEPANASALMTEADWVVAVSRFVEWPNTQLRDLVVCSPSSSPRLMLDNKSVRGLRVVEKTIKNTPEAKSCHVLALFSERNPSRWIQAVRGAPVLTIGRGREFCIHGGIVCVLGDDTDSRYRHNINLETLARAGLYARNELLVPQNDATRSVPQK
jgi:YfiR/HmsC-like